MPLHRKDLKWIDLNPALPYGTRPSDPEDTFMRRGLARAGVMLRTAEGTEYLIGDVNDEGGGCGCCGYVRPSTMVVSYALVLED